ncbi:glycoside hydrolase family 76 protein [Flavivirga sp. 57AJ16]|uniref:glycoside hydrolase family 76 protein n=1 Tax=Flavivirga sp. 57AJ16 TaxID=3025307 RepID=UPI002366DAA8|nr:glycoside hydrolase family 76 protein [Flavivirga sp. 57AJ16]MDD7884496.1 glycoside hydrolase family 76 protein [Flavivirga sp. 57AJ16]
MKLLKSVLCLFVVVLTNSCEQEEFINNLETKSNLEFNKKKSGKLNQALSTSVYWDKAQQTHDFIFGNTLTSYNSYRANLTTNVNNAWEWYNMSHIYADAEMVRQGDNRYESYMNNTYNWMANMWDYSPSYIGGYFSAANLDGSNAGGDKYVDDNSISGVTYLDCYNTTTGTQQQQYLNSATAIANFLMTSGIWDYTFNGGFWWNDGAKNVAPNVKPTQTNALAMQLFIRLYGITGQPYYLSWADSIKNWLETEMFDTSDGLFIWQIEPNGVKRYEKFTYDNAIMIEAYLNYYQVTGDNSYLNKAQNLGISLNTLLWDQTAGVYKFNTTDPRVNPAWCGWGSQAMIKLHEGDGNPAWLDYAQDNIDFMNNFNRNTINNGYYHFTNLDGSLSDGRYESVDQAWMQRIQAMLSQYR